ncbi:hypothetical protein AB1Y20_009568 [Prymnesium parvum]|uniref:F5/8 type C domain-containing protein n=1 Tax=Prymnesium parvum TaxID=97485 RepID=A0AB34K0N8_PRYPA
MSSTFDDPRWAAHDFSGAACHDGVWGGGQAQWSFCHTQNQNNPWLSLNLGATSYVSSVRIYGRSDCCQSQLGTYQVWVATAAGNPTLLSGSAASRCQPADTLVAPATVGPFTVSCGLSGSYVTLFLPGNSRLLMIDELVVYGTVPTLAPTQAPTLAPTASPTAAPTAAPTALQELSVVGSSMSSTFDDPRWAAHDFSGAACHDGVWGGGQAQWSFCHTNRQSNPWLSLNLGATSYVASVRIYGRSDCCQSQLGVYQVWVATAAGDPTLLPGSAASRCQPGSTLVAPATVGPFTVSCGLSGSYVTLFLPGNSRLLMIDELVVTGSP